MKAYISISLLGLLLLIFLSPQAKKTEINTTPIQAHELAINEGRYFNPQEFYKKQCNFCHNESRKIAPPMGEIKKAYLEAYPKKETFIKKMTAFVLNPVDKNRLIKDNPGKYKVMPPNLFFDEQRIKKVVEHIHKNISIAKKTIPNKINKLNENIKSKPIEKTTSNNKVLKNDKIEVKLNLEKGDDLCKILDLKPVGFKYGKSIITPNMAKQLNKIVIFLKDNPSINIEIRNHTDARGSAKHNLALSKFRALSIKTYLISKGIDIKRIKTKGMGETQILNHCKDGVKCSDAEHRENRRTEMIIF